MQFICQNNEIRSVYSKEYTRNNKLIIKEGYHENRNRYRWKPYRNGNR